MIGTNSGEESGIYVLVVRLDDDEDDDDNNQLWVFIHVVRRWKDHTELLRINLLKKTWMDYLIKISIKLQVCFYLEQHFNIVENSRLIIDFL